MNIKTLKTNLENAVNEIIKAFEEKQEVSFQFFVGDDITGIASFGCTYYFNISDICLDILTEQPKGLIFEWHEECLENKNKTISYKSYSMGLRFENSRTIK